MCLLVVEGALEVNLLCLQTAAAKLLFHPLCSVTGKSDSDAVDVGMSGDIYLGCLLVVLLLFSFPFMRRN